jgi:hypothetical protein
MDISTSIIGFDRAFSRLLPLLRALTNVNRARDRVRRDGGRARDVRMR